MQHLFDEEDTAKKAKRIVEGILKARSPRLSDIARTMPGKEDTNYKCIQRFLEKVRPQELLLRLFQETATFVIGDPTEMPRPQARKTDYVGTLKDDKTSGYWLLFPFNALSWADHSMRLRELFIQDHQSGSDFAQPASL